MTDWRPATRRQVGLDELSRARRQLQATISEAEWQEQVVQLAQHLGWKHLHVRRSIGKGKKWVTTTNVVGWPDLLLWHRRHGFAAVELKVPPNQASPEQLAVLAELEAAGARTMVAYPTDLGALRDLLEGR